MSAAVVGTEKIPVAGEPSLEEKQPDTGRRRAAVASGSEAAVLLTGVAIWPVWAYLARAYLTPGADLSPALVLALAVAWAALKWRSALRDESPTGIAALVPLLVYAGSYFWLPPLARATFGLAAFGTALLGLRGLGFRDCSGLLALVLLAAPSADTVSFFLGAPIRSASAQLAAGWLVMGGVPVSVEGAMLRVGQRLFSVDAPCSGVNGLWSGMVVAACVSVYRGLGPARTLALVSAAAALCIPANGWRAASLVYFSRLETQGVRLGGDAGHSMVGVVVFAITIGALAVLAQLLSRAGHGASGLARPRLRAFRTGRVSRWSTALVILPAAVAAAVPLVPQAPARTSKNSDFPGWPSHWLGQPLTRLPETALDRRWARLSPAPLARFSCADGGELLLRWTDRSGRWLHPPEDCYRGHGYEVTPMPPVQSPAPGQSQPVVWRRFSARRGAERLEVRSVILSVQGPAYPDPAWWWWKVSGPGATDRGPWWIATIQRQSASAAPSTSSANGSALE